MGNCNWSSSSAVAVPTGARAQGEDKVVIALKAKRANVYTSNAVDAVTSTKDGNYAKKTIPKTNEQAQFISTALSQNYMFASLNKKDLDAISLHMEIMDVAKGANITTQGESGEYFYIVSQGTFSVMVDRKIVSQIVMGGSFGELALLYDAPRQATVTATADSVVFSLDRESYRYIVANSCSHRASETKAALQKVPLLANLTEEQVDKISDSVEVFSFSQGDTIIKKGSEGKAFYMIKEGTVAVSDIGEEAAQLTLSEGDYFGERSLIKLEPRAATVTAESPVVLLMALDVDSFKSLLGPLQDVLDHNMNMQALTSVKLFSKLTTQERSKLSENFKIETFQKDTVIMKQGETGNKFYIIKGGTAKVEANGTDVAMLSTGLFFGEMALLTDEPRKATVIATTALECFVLDRDTFTKILGSMQDFMSEETATRLQKLKKSAIDGSVSTDEVEIKEKVDILFNDLKLVGVLGTGTFGRVSLVQHTKTSSVYALKKMQKFGIVQHKQQKNVLLEKQVMMQCNHPFVLRLYTTFKDPKALYMLLEFIQGGELFSVLHSPKRDGVPDESAKFYSAGVILAIAHLHGKNIAYRDMKPENCLIDKDGYPKLVDFGFAKVITGKSFTLCGTPEYLAPELVLNKGHNKAVDYWAFGILIFEMIAGYSPFCDLKGYDVDVICRNIVANKLVFPKVVSKDARDLISALLTRDLSSRLGNLKRGCDDIKDKDWFKSLDWKQYEKKVIKAPWIPPAKSATDTSNFDPVDPEVELSPGFIDRDDWDREF